MIILDYLLTFIAGILLNMGLVHLVNFSETRHHPIIARSKTPRLAITGSKDIQVDPVNLERMAEPAQPFYLQAEDCPADRRPRSADHLGMDGEENLRMTHTQHENLIAEVRGLHIVPEREISDSEIIFVKAFLRLAHPGRGKLRGATFMSLMLGNAT